MRVEIGHYAAKGRPTLPQEQRLAWLREQFTGSSESLPYRIAGILLLLYAQPVVRVAKLRADAVETNGNMRIAFGTHPVRVMDRLRSRGIDLRGARNTALGEHLLASPPPLVADALEYSHQIAFLHADAAGDAWSRYVDLRTKP